jgi:hypothetical protein
LDPQVAPADAASFAVFAINLPARDGAVTRVELLDTPGVMTRGLTSDCKVLDDWNAVSGHANRTRMVTMRYPRASGAAAEAR